MGRQVSIVSFSHDFQRLPSPSLHHQSDICVTDWTFALASCVGATKPQMPTEYKLTFTDIMTIILSVGPVFVSMKIKTMVHLLLLSSCHFEFLFTTSDETGWKEQHFLKSSILNFLALLSLLMTHFSGSHIFQNTLSGKKKSYCLDLSGENFMEVSGGWKSILIQIQICQEESLTKGFQEFKETWCTVSKVCFSIYFPR